MRSRAPALLSLLVLAPCLAGGPGCGRRGQAEPIARTADDLFTPTALPRFELTLGADEMAALGKKRRKYVEGTFRYGGATWAKVGIRLKGHRAMRGWDSKPSFKVSFDKFSPGRRFLGLRTLTLNAMVEDPTMLRETLGYQVFRAAGAPAPRTGYAEVWLNGERLGLYLDVESVDEVFAARVFGDGAGDLFEGEYGCDLYPADVAGFERDGGEDGEGGARPELAALAAAAESGDARALGLGGDGAGALLDRPRVLAFLAASALVGDFDGYRHSHNYRLYHPAGGGWALIPWGLDRVFKKRLPVYDSGGRLARLCFADAGCRRDYVRTLRELVARFEALRLPAAADERAAFVERAAARDRRKPYDAARSASERAALRRFLVERPAEVRAQLACLDGEREVDRDGDGAGCTDCDDGDPRIHPGAAEVCGDRVDDDCSGLADDAPACACPAEDVEGATFYLCDLPMTWQEAAELCAAQGHALARIDSVAQSKALFKKLKKRSAAPWWIGLDDRAEEGVWRWQDRSPVTFTYWKSHQPDNDGCNEDCGAIKDKAGGKWHDTHCGLRRPFICR